MSAKLIINLDNAKYFLLKFYKKYRRLEKNIYLCKDFKICILPLHAIMTNEYTYREGRPTEAAEIARLIMMAMTDECCQYFCGNDHTLSEFHELITRLTSRTDTQYSYANTICCLDAKGRVVGICTSYDGGELLRLRQAFIDEAMAAFGIDHSSIPMETEAGELYIDSLAVLPEHRGNGIATRLIEKTKEKCSLPGIPAVGLLVDDGNPKAELLYNRCGFEVVGVNEWGGHSMKHMVCK